MPTTTTEVPLLYLRRANPNEPVELVIGYGDHSCTVYVLRPSQLAKLAVDAVLMTTPRQLDSFHATRRLGQVGAD